MDRLPCKSLLTAFCTLIVHHAVVFLLLTRFSGGESQETGQPQPIVAMVGDDITLPCHVKPGSGAGVGMLEWSRPDLNPRFVHVWRSGGDHLVDQNPSYRGRTSVSLDKLKQGDTSLKLSKVKLTDEGTYRCFIPRLITDYSVQLIVGAVINMSTVSSGELECKSKGWYPEPEVLWLDGEGNLLPAGPTETVRGPDDLYTVSSRVTVEKRHSNSFTCRVQQKDINQTRETHIQVPDDFFKDPSKPSASTIIGLFAGLMIILALVYVVCRWRQNKLKKKNHEEEEPQRVREKTRDSVNNSSEQEFLVKTETGREENREETKNLENDEEEENNERFLSEEGGRPCESEEETHQSQQNVNRRNLEETPEATTTATEGQGSTEPEGQEDETQAGRDTKPEEETNRTKPLPQTETKPEQPTEEGLEKSQGPEDGGGPTGGTEDGEMSGDGHAEELAERESVTDGGSSVDPIVAEETKNLDNELEENNTRSLSEEGGHPCQREEETHQSQQNVNRGNLEIPEAATTATEGQSSTEPEGQEDETQAGRDTR